MNTTLNKSVQIGTIKVSDETVHLATEGDFSDFITYSPKEKKVRAVQVLRGLVRQFGTTRSPLTDLYRSRLSQLRTHLSQ